MQPRMKFAVRFGGNQWATLMLAQLHGHFAINSVSESENGMKKAPEDFAFKGSTHARSVYIIPQIDSGL